MVISGPGVPSEVDLDDFSRRGHPYSAVLASQSDHNGIRSSVLSERSSEKGFNWRKNRQKHIRGSEVLRSNYKCTHPNCEAKNPIACSNGGLITEIIYRGTHDHSKPQSAHGLSTGIMSTQEERPDSVTGHNAIGEVAEGAASNMVPDQVDANGGPFSKQSNLSIFSSRKMDSGRVNITQVVKPIHEPRVVVQTLSEVDILDDGYRWRKYGQKVVRGNPNPRSYYKCTNSKCPVRKRVERAPHDPKAVITAYNGKHNHGVPTARISSRELAGSSAANLVLRDRSGQNNTINLHLGLGTRPAAENASDEKATHYGVLNGRVNQLPFGHSLVVYPQNFENALLGP
uniref:WRKY transcription factor 25 n=1 Tax=Santalum album TaxID=35974 RepID=A0A650C2X4_SANAL|nr:WRKY transcription factor 25 [Santalum album]